VQLCCSTGFRFPPAVRATSACFFSIESATLRGALKPFPLGLCQPFSMAARLKVLRCQAGRAARNTRDTPAT
jgi:hypothetical protein